MKKTIVMLMMLGLVSSLSMPAFAIKPLNDKFIEIYEADKDTSDALKTAIKDAKCNLCHAGADKKKRNPFGKAIQEEMKAAKFDFAAYKKDAKNEKYTDELKAIFKKATEQKAGKTDKTFADRMKAGELPGGDKDGKGLE